MLQRVYTQAYLQSANQLTPNPWRKGLLVTALALIVVVITGQAITAHVVSAAPPPPTTVTLAPPLKQETRAVWSWAGRRARNRAAVDQLVTQIDRARLNVVLLQIYKDGTAYFEPSHHRFPKAAERLTNQSPFVDEEYPDALSYLLALRDARRADQDPTNDFEVHAWFAVHSGGKVQVGAKWPQPDLTAPYMLNALFPEFQLKYGDYYRKQDERYVDHAVSVVQQPRFQAYMTNLIAGVVEDYQVDGVHLDYIRTGGICFNNEALDYPGTAYDYPGCQQDYAEWTQKTYGQAASLWEDTDGYRQIQDDNSGRVAAWLSQAVDSLVKRIHDAVKAVNPATVISVAAVITVPGSESERGAINGQAAWHWLDEGWIDAAFPTFYTTTAATITERVTLFQQAIRQTQARAQVFPGLAVHDVEEERSRRPDVLIDQLKVLLQDDAGRADEEVVHGVALFRAEYLSKRMLDSLAAGPFREPAIPFWGE